MVQKSECEANLGADDPRIMSGNLFDCAPHKENSLTQNFNIFLSKALKVAANQGAWEPDGQASCCFGLGTLEQLLCLPNLMFEPVLWALGIPVLASSPDQVDLHERRRTAGLWRISELENVGKKYGVPMPACTKIKEILTKHVENGDGVPSISPTELLGSINAPFYSTKKLAISVLQVLTAALFLWVLVIAVDVLFPREGL